jgi:hypothetical protein
MSRWLGPPLLFGWDYIDKYLGKWKPHAETTVWDRSEAAR